MNDGVWFFAVSNPSDFYPISVHHLCVTRLVTSCEIRWSVGHVYLVSSTTIMGCFLANFCFPLGNYTGSILSHCLPISCRLNIPIIVSELYPRQISQMISPYPKTHPQTQYKNNSLNTPHDLPFLLFSTRTPKNPKGSPDQHSTATLW